MKFTGPSGEFFRASELRDVDAEQITQRIPSSLTLLWITEPGTELIIDGREHKPDSGTMICLTEFHAYKEQVDFGSLDTDQVDFTRSFNFLVEQLFR
jgi:hypothetical protein